jgi:hypothetical protein
MMDLDSLVIPPRTGAGMATRAAANLEKIPMTIRKKLFGVTTLSRVFFRDIPAKVTSFAVCTSSQRNDTIVLSECGHGCDCHQGSQETIKAIGEDTT